MKWERNTNEEKKRTPLLVRAVVFERTRPEGLFFPSRAERAKDKKEVEERILLLNKCVWWVCLVRVCYSSRWRIKPKTKHKETWKKYIYLFHEEKQRSGLKRITRKCSGDFSLLFFSPLLRSHSKKKKDLNLKKKQILTGKQSHRHRHWTRQVTTTTKNLFLLWIIKKCLRKWVGRADIAALLSYILIDDDQLVVHSITHTQQLWLGHPICIGQWLWFCFSFFFWTVLFSLENICFMSQLVGKKFE